jgi:WD40 repeat protein
MNDVVITYDVFLSYSRRDMAQVELLATHLTREAGFRVWLDRARLQPGYSWRAEIETAMNTSAAALIVWGPHGPGPVQRQERDLAYAIRDARPNFRVLYVLLPNTPPPQGSWVNVDTWIRFGSSLDDPDAFARLVAALKGEPPPTLLVADLPDDPAPYRGLVAFGVDDARFFFGRTAYTEDMLERLPYHPFLTVLGPSGSGKTSLVQAGLLARLQAGVLPGSADWPWLLVRPGPDPFQSLATTLARLQPQSDPLTARDALLWRLQDSPKELPTLLQALLPPQGRLVLLVDRLEELFTLCEVEAARRAFLDALLALVQHPHRPAWAVVTMRADFYGHVGRYADLASQVVNHQVYLKSMTEQEVAEVIEAPAAQVGAIFEKGLAKQIGTDVQARGELSLPLLQHTLDLLWRKRRGRWLTWDAYEEVGGVAGALRYHADRVIEGLSAEEQEVARRLLMRLIWLEAGAGMMAGRRIEKTALVEQGPNPGVDERVLQRLADERLVVLRGEREQATAELVHDSLPVNWEKLRQWVQEDRQFLLGRQRLGESLADWERTRRDEGTLLRGTPLAEAERWLMERPGDLNPEERDFIQASVALREVSERNQRWLMLVSVGAAVVFCVLAGWAGMQWWRANEQRNIALSRELAASAISQLPVDPELSLLLAREVANKSSTVQAEDALRQALVKSHIRAAMRGHTNAVSNAAFSPDGTLVVTASEDHTARIWQANTGQSLAQLDRHKAGVTKTVFSPDGQLVVTASADGTARLWKAATGESVVELRGHTKAVWSADFSPDGKSVVTASADGTARVWEVMTGKPTAEMYGHKGEVLSAAFSPDGKWVVTVSLDKTARVWETATGTPLAELQGQPAPERGLAPMRSAMFSPDGKLVAIAGDRWGKGDPTARIWETSTWSLRTDLHGHTSHVFSIAFSPDSQFVVTASLDGTARVWEAATGHCVTVLVGHIGWVTHAVFSPDGRFIVTGSPDNTARVWERATGKSMAELRGHTKGVKSVAFSADGRFVVTASRDNTARVWEPSTARGLVALNGHVDDVQSAAFSPDGRLVVTASADMTARVWDVSTGQSQVEMRGHTSDVHSAVFSPNGKFIVTAGGGIADQKDNTARVWDASTGQSLIELRGHGSAVRSAMFSHQGERVITASWDGTPRIWDVRTGQTLVELHGHNGDVRSAAFSPDDKFVVTASWDGTARVWEAQTGQSLVEIREHKDFVNSAMFNPNGSFIVTASRDKTAKIYVCDICGSIEDMLVLAKTRVTRELTPEERKRYLH